MQLTSEMIVGLIALFGISMLAILMMLKRYGVIKFVNGDRCPEHESFCNSFKALKEEHIVQGEILKQHGKQLYMAIKSQLFDLFFKYGVKVKER